MSGHSGRKGPAVGTRRQIIALLRKGSLTAAQIAAHLGLTHNAVRGHIAALLNDEIVEEVSLQKSRGRPAILYEVRPQAEPTFSYAYVPFAAQLVEELHERTGEAELTEIMRAVGRRLASTLPRPSGPFPLRVRAASALLHSLGSLNDVEARDDRFVIRAHACILGAAVHDRPEVCRALETLLSEVVGAPVRECCERGSRPRCRFEVGVSRSA